MQHSRRIHETPQRRMILPVEMKGTGWSNGLVRSFTNRKRDF
jgi:hypothetical protein